MKVKLMNDGVNWFIVLGLLPVKIAVNECSFVRCAYKYVFISIAAIPFSTHVVPEICHKLHKNRRFAAATTLSSSSPPIRGTSFSSLLRFDFFCVLVGLVSYGEKGRVHMHEKRHHQQQHDRKKSDTEYTLHTFTPFHFQNVMCCKVLSTTTNQSAAAAARFLDWMFHFARLFVCLFSFHFFSFSFAVGVFLIAVWQFVWWNEFNQ